MERFASVFSLKRASTRRRPPRRSLSFTFGFRETRVLTEMGEGAVSRKSLGPVHGDVTGQAPFYSKAGILPIYDSTESLDSNKRASATIKIKHLHRLCDLSRFPKLDDCAHFHYDQVELTEIKVYLTTENQENIHLHHNETEDDPPFYVSVDSGGKIWMVRRTYENFRLLDKQLHKCIFDRKFSQLPEIPKGGIWLSDGMEVVQTKLSDYLTRFSEIAGSMINCGPILNWLEMDNRGNRLMVTQESAINTPAIAAAHVVKRYTARAQDEISFEVGDIISVIDMPPPEDTMWWRGKRGFEVGFFPCECVEIIGDQVPQAMVSRIPQTPPKPVLRKRGKLISFLRMFFFTRPNRNLLKQSGIFKERVFGCDLGEHLLNTGQNVPMVLKCCSQAIEDFGIIDGIYRLSGVSSNIQKLRLAFDENREPDLSAEEYLQDIHCISSLLKMYFRELPNPLLTYQLYDKFAAAVQDEGDKLMAIHDVVQQLPPPHYSAIQDDDDRLMKIHDIVQQLPPPHYRTSQYLFNHLATVAASGIETGMHPKNLAIVWAPNLLRSKELESGGGAAALQGVGLQAVVTEFLIRYADLIFSDKMPVFSGNDKCGAQKRARPKSLAISTPTKLLSLEEARERALGTGNSPPNSQKFIEVGGGPSSLPEKYHTVIEVPASRKRSSSVKGKKNQGSWKNFFTRGKQNPKGKRKGSAPSPGSFYAQTDKALTEDDVAARRKLRSTKSVDSIVSIGSMPGKERISPRNSGAGSSYTEAGVINFNMLQMERTAPLILSTNGRRGVQRARSLPEETFEKQFTMIVDIGLTDDESENLQNGETDIENDDVFADDFDTPDDKRKSDLGDMMIAQAAAEIAGKTKLMTQIEEKMCESMDRGGSPEMPGLSSSAPVTVGPLSMEMSIDDISLTWSDFSGQQDMLSPDGDGFNSLLMSMTGCDGILGKTDADMASPVTSPQYVGSPIQGRRDGSMTSLDRLRVHGGSHTKLTRSPSDDIFPMEITETIDDAPSQTTDESALMAKMRAQQNARIRSYSSGAHWPERDLDLDAEGDELARGGATSPLGRHLSLPSDIEKSLENIIDDSESAVVSSYTPSDADTEKTIASLAHDRNKIQVTAIIHDEGVAVDTPSPMEEPTFDNLAIGADASAMEGTTYARDTAAEQKTSLDSAFGSHFTDSGYASSLPMTHVVSFTPDTDSDLDLDPDKLKLSPLDLNLDNSLLDGVQEQLNTDLTDIQEPRPVRKSRSYEKAISSGEGIDLSEDESSKRASMLEDVEEVSEGSSDTVTDIRVESERLNTGKIFVKERSAKSSESDHEIIIDYPPAARDAAGSRKQSLKDSSQSTESPIVAGKAKLEYVEHKMEKVHVVERRLSSEGQRGSQYSEVHSPETEVPSSQSRDNFERSFEETLDSLSPRDDRFSLEIADFLPPSQGAKGENKIPEKEAPKVVHMRLKQQGSCDSDTSSKEQRNSKISCATPSSISPEPHSIHLVDEICEIYEQTKRQSGLFDTKADDFPRLSSEREIPSPPSERPAIREIQVKDLFLPHESPEDEVQSPPTGSPVPEVETPLAETPLLETPVQEELSLLESPIESSATDQDTLEDAMTDDLDAGSDVFAVEVRPEDLEESGLNLEVSVAEEKSEVVEDVDYGADDARYNETLEDTLDMLEETSNMWRRSSSSNQSDGEVPQTSHRLSAELDQMLVEKRVDEVTLDKVIQTIEHAEHVLDEAAAQMVSEEDEISAATEQTEVAESLSPEPEDLDTSTLEYDEFPDKLSPESVKLASPELSLTSFESEDVTPDVGLSSAPTPEPVDLTPEQIAPTPETIAPTPKTITPSPTASVPEVQDPDMPTIMTTSLPPMHLDYKDEPKSEESRKEPEFVKDVGVKSESLPRKSKFSQEESKLPLPVKTPPSVPKRSREPSSIVSQVDWISRDRAKLKENEKEKEVPAKVELASRFGFKEKTGSESSEEKRLSRSRLSWERSPDPELVTKPSWKKSPSPEPEVRRLPEEEKVDGEKGDENQPSWKPREAMRLSSSRFQNVKPLFSVLDPEEHKSLAPLITSPPPGSVAPTSFQDTAPTSAQCDESTDEVFLPKQQEKYAEKPYKISASDILAKYGDDPPTSGRRDSGSRLPVSRSSVDSDRSLLKSDDKAQRKLIQPGWTKKDEKKADVGERSRSKVPLTVDTSGAHHEPESLSPKDGFTPREKMQLNPSRFQSLSTSLTGVTLDKLREPALPTGPEKESSPVSPGSLMSSSYPADVTKGVGLMRRSKSSVSDDQAQKSDPAASDWRGKKSKSFGQDADALPSDGTSRLPKLEKDRNEENESLLSKQMKAAEKLFIDEASLDLETSAPTAEPEAPERKGAGVKRKKSVKELLSKFESGKSEEEKAEQSENIGAEETVENDKYRPAVFQKPKIIRLRSLSPSQDSLSLYDKKSPEDGDKNIRQSLPQGDREVAMDTSPKYRRSSRGETGLGVQEKQRSPRLSPKTDSDSEVKSSEKVSPKLRPKPSPSEVEAVKSRNRSGEEDSGSEKKDSEKSPGSIRGRLKYFDSSSEGTKTSPEFSRLRRQSDDRDAESVKSKIAKPVTKFGARSQSQQFENDQKDDNAHGHFRRKSDMSDKDSIYASHDKEKKESDNEALDLKSRLQQPQVRTDSGRLNKATSRESVSSASSRGSNRSLTEDADKDVSVQSAKEKFQAESRRVKSTGTDSDSKKDDTNSWPRRSSGDGLQGPKKWIGRSMSNQPTSEIEAPIIIETTKPKTPSPEEKAAGVMFGIKLRKTKRPDAETAS